MPSRLGPRARARRKRLADLAAVAEVVIHQREREHRLRDRRGPEPDARIVPARRDDLGRLAMHVDRTSRHLDARRRFQRETDQNVLPARDPAEDSARRVLREALRRDLVAMLAAPLADAAEAVADLDALDRVDAHHRARYLRVELVEDRLAEPGGNPGREHVDARADRVAVAAQLNHERFELLDLRRIRTEERIAVDRIEVDRLELDRSELREIAADANADALLQEFARDRAGRDAHRGLARRCPPAAAIVSESVFLVVRVIRVARAIAILDLLVIARALILVLDQEADRRAGRPALEHAGQDPHAIRLAALRDETRLPRPAPVEILLDILLRQRQAGR